MIRRGRARPRGLVCRYSKKGLVNGIGVARKQARRSRGTFTGPNAITVRSAVEFAVSLRDAADGKEGERLLLHFPCPVNRENMLAPFVPFFSFFS